jgi:hypothetical protein
MAGDAEDRRTGPVAAWALAVLDPPEVDEFDLDLRLGEHAHRWLGMPLGAQTDPAGCLPTGGQGAGTTCDTNDATCNATCGGLATCPHTQCNTCANTCGHTVCENTCDADCAPTFECHTQNRHVPTCDCEFN